MSFPTITVPSETVDTRLQHHARQIAELTEQIDCLTKQVRILATRTKNEDSIPSPDKIDVPAAPTKHLAAAYNSAVTPEIPAAALTNLVAPAETSGDYGGYPLGFVTETTYQYVKEHFLVCEPDGFAMMAVSKQVRRHGLDWVARGDIVAGLIKRCEWTVDDVINVGWEDSDVEADIRANCRGLEDLSSLLDRLCALGQLRASTCVLSRGQMQASRYHLTPRGMLALANTWITPEAYSLVDRHLLRTVAGGKTNGTGELAADFGPARLLSLTEAGLIVRAVCAVCE